jgi:NADP-dependent 3-hydroxy acid dehydrogenase YdfG
VQVRLARSSSFEWASIAFPAQGIGKAIALRLADDGFDVAVNDIAQNAENLAAVVDAIKSKGRASSAHIADVSVDEQVKAMVEAVVAAHGGIDVVCHCRLPKPFFVDGHIRWWRTQE